jgi:hypothetical protein
VREEPFVPDSPLNHPCPFCGAPPGARCRTIPVDKVHAERYETMRSASKKEENG